MCGWCIIAIFAKIAYPKGIPKNGPGQKKGPEAAEAYKIARQEFRDAAREQIKILIGKWHILQMLHTVTVYSHYAPETFKM